MTRHYKVSLTFVGPILTQSTTAEAYGVDAPMARNRQGDYVLPASLIKGKLRQGLEELAGLKLLPWPVDRLLGGESGNMNSPDLLPVSPLRARLQLDEFTCRIRPDSIAPTRCRIRLDEDLGSVARGALLTLEVPFAPGEEVTFDGAMRLMEATQGEAAEILPALKQGFCMITSIGAERTVGFGRLKAVNIHPEEIQSVPDSRNRAMAAGQMFFDLRLLGPFCIARSKADNNLFQSEDFVPGGVLKGALAAAWLASLACDTALAISGNPPVACRHKILWRYFSQVRFSHAFPRAGGNRFVYRPLSLTQYRTGLDADYRDVLQLAHPALLQFTNSEGQMDWSSPEFQVDWKSGHSCACGPQPASQHRIAIDFPQPKLDRELRVRTAINRSDRTAEDQQLFGMETIQPGSEAWCFRVDIPDLPGDEGTVLATELLDLLTSDLEGIGKTKVSGRVEIANDPPTLPAMAAARQIPGFFAVSLQTPALICNPGGLQNSSREELFTAYSAYWELASENSMKLVRYFAAQRLAGGYYLHRRFRDGESYRPWLLTTEGSVFLLEVTDIDAASKKIAEWQRFGLPPLEDDGIATDWQSCPYMRENGYGEILVNMAVHTDKMLVPAERYDMTKEARYATQMEV